MPALADACFRPISGVDQAPPRESPGAEHEARLPVRQKPHCEALSGVADPITTWPRKVDRLYPGGWIVLVSRFSPARSEARLIALAGPAFGRPAGRANLQCGRAFNLDGGKRQAQSIQLED